MMGGRSITSVCQCVANSSLTPQGTCPGTDPGAEGTETCRLRLVLGLRAALPPAAFDQRMGLCAACSRGLQREVGKRSQPDPPLLGSVISHTTILPFPSPTYPA